MSTTLAAPRGSPVDATSFRRALRQFASGVTVITCRDERGEVHGMTATAFSSLSLQPPLVMVAVARGTRCHRLVQRESRFGVSILAEDQMHLSRHFGGAPRPETRPRFTGLNDVPVIEDALGQLSCRLEQALEGGDHSIFIGLVTEARAGSGAPLLHFDGRYHGVGPGREG